MSRSLVLLSGERTSIPEAEAKALFLAYDPTSRFESPEERILMVESRADPFLVGSRIAFSRRVGPVIGSPAEARNEVRGKRVRLRSFHLSGDQPEPIPGKILEGLDTLVDLQRPEYEFTLVRGRHEYLALTRPLEMNQAWSTRRPRARAFFHPSAIFPKLSRALVNLTRFKAGDVFLDPFCGTASLGIEAFEAGADVVVSDRASKMALGALANMNHFRHRWLGVIRADANHPPFRRVDAVASDIPYGRASSTGGAVAVDLLRNALETLPGLLAEGSRMVLMHPQSLEVVETPDLALEEEHHLYVHKLLTRTITVLRRR